MRRKIAAALAAMMLSSCMPFGALAEDAPLVERIVPASENMEEAPEAEFKLQRKKFEQTDAGWVALGGGFVPGGSFGSNSGSQTGDETPETDEDEKKDNPWGNMGGFGSGNGFMPGDSFGSNSGSQTEDETPETDEDEKKDNPWGNMGGFGSGNGFVPGGSFGSNSGSQTEDETPETDEDEKKDNPWGNMGGFGSGNGFVPGNGFAPGGFVPGGGSHNGNNVPEYAQFDMTASVKDGIIIVKVSGASDGKMIAIEVSGNGVKEVNGILTKNGEGSGELGKLDEEKEEFVALDPGTYTVRAYYESKDSIGKKTSVTVLGTNTVVPPSSGDSGSSGGSGSSGSVDAITPVAPPSSGETEGVKAFTIFPVVTYGSIAVVIDGASSREIEVKLLDKDGKTVGASAIIGNGFVQLGRFASGTYTVQAQYVTPVVGEDNGYDYKRVSAQAVVPEGVGTPGKIEAVDIQAKIEKGKDYIIVTVTQAADQKMMVSVDGLGDKEIAKGGSVRFDGLTPGKSYAVEIDYVHYVAGAKKYTATVTIDPPVFLGRIKITAVTPGTNMLTVSGVAMAGQQVILSTTPTAASDVYAMPGANGVFKAEIACAAGMYTAVTAKYSADTSKADTVTGKWLVSAPMGRPTLNVDPVDSRSTTVIAKTTAGVVVELKTGDYTQKATADNSGILRFSLPHTYAAGTELTFVVYYGRNQFFVHKVRVDRAEYAHTLEYGSEGDQVRLLTARLKKLGYPVDETSRYGSTVREAVRLFQLANGLEADGIAGPETQKAIFSVGAIAYGTKKYPTLVRGDEGMSLIYTLQQRLKDLGYYTIKVDGIFGSGTQRAVREFQRVNGLTVTGKADHATQALLYSSAAKSADYAVSGDYKTLSRSSKYKSAVVPLQKRLRSLGYYSGNIDGYFGSQTYRAVRNFQSRNGLTVTGVADPYTQQVLYSASAKTYSGGTSSSGVTTSGYRLLYWGCRGEAVTRLQNALIKAGYKSIVRTADGIFGQWTYDAVRAYQKDHGLAVDGIAGKNTQNKLYGTNY